MDSDKYLIRNYSCEICNQKFYHLALIYGCQYGHFFCQRCYNGKYYSNRSIRCPHKRCKSTLSRMDDAEKYNNSNKMFIKPTEMAATNAFQLSARNSLSTIAQNSFSNLSYASMSRKPIRCPYPSCQKTLTAASFETHFKFEHKYVAYVTTKFDTKTGLEFNPYIIKHDQNLCMVLLNLFQERKNLTLLAGAELHMESPIKPLMLVLGTRVANYQIFEDESDHYECTDNFVENLNQPVDKVMLWVACNVPTRFKYTIAVSTPCRTIRLKYYGIISLICEDAVELCRNGRGLILNQSHLVGMTNGGKKSIILDIVLHDEDGIETDRSRLHSA